MKMEPQSGRGKRRLLALLVIVLVVAVGLIQAVHTHSELGKTDAHCVLCAVAHTTAAIAAPISLPVLISSHAPLTLFEPSPNYFEQHKPVYSRPPPCGA